MMMVDLSTLKANGRTCDLGFYEQNAAKQGHQDETSAEKHLEGR